MNGTKAGMEVGGRSREAARLPRRTKRIVVIESDSDMGDWLLDELRRAGFQVALATTGHDGIGLIRSVCADAVVSDMDQHDLPGIDLLRELRELGRMPRVILTTTVGSERQAAHALQLGASAILTRPFRMEHLLSQVTMDDG